MAARPWTNAKSYEEAERLGWDPRKGECSKCGKPNSIPLKEGTKGRRAVGMYCVECSFAGLTGAGDADEDAEAR